MIENEEQLRYSIECLAKMYGQQDREAAEPLWDPDTRAEMAADTETMRLKIEREVAAYLAKKYELVKKKEPEKAEVAA